MTVSGDVRERTVKAVAAALAKAGMDAAQAQQAAEDGVAAGASMIDGGSFAGGPAAAGPPAQSLPALVTIPGVEILAAGTWELSSGRQTFTRDDMASAVEAAACPSVGNPIIKIGHLDDRFAPGPGQDGEPAIGRVANLRLNGSGMKVLGDYAGMPGWLAAISASAYPRRSIEGSYRFRCQTGHDHPFVISAVALLGVTPPGVGVLSGLPDIASLYGLTAAAAPERSWRTKPKTQEGTVMAVTEEDVRRAYYAAGVAPHDWWITELHMNPTQLIVSAGDGKLYRVPFTVAADAVTFGDAAELAGYADLAASRGTGAVMVFASAAESRDVAADADEHDYREVGGGEPVVPQEPEEPEADHDPETIDGDGLDASWDGDLAGLPDLAGVTVEDLEAALAEETGVAASKPVKAKKAKLGTGARFAALKSSLAKKGASDPGALAAWIGRKKFGKARFHKLASKARGKAATASAVEVDAAGNHAACSLTHAHNHAAMGSQGGDATHAHSHTHSGDNRHDHAHATAGAGNRRGESDVEFTEGQTASLRAMLGLEDDQEATADLVIEGLRKGRVAASRRPADGPTIEIDRGEWEALNGRVKAAEQYQQRQRVNERDQVLAAAVKDGKFTAARKPQYARAWDADPDGAREMIASLPKNTVPVLDIGSAAGDEGELLDEEYRSLFPPGATGS